MLMTIEAGFTSFIVLVLLLRFVGRVGPWLGLRAFPHRKMRPTADGDKRHGFPMRKLRLSVGLDYGNATGTPWLSSPPNPNVFRSLSTSFVCRVSLSVPYVSYDSLFSVDHSTVSMFSVPY